MILFLLFRVAPSYGNHSPFVSRPDVMGEIDINMATIMYDFEQDRPFVFKITTKRKGQDLFAASSKDDMDSWINALQQASSFSRLQVGLLNLNVRGCRQSINKKQI